jgi:ABC-2 type transport system ATP-binding protein
MSARTTTLPTTIEVDHVSKVYGEFVALHDVSFSVKKGRVTAFLGPNGAGKSTTMKILTGFVSPTSGSVSLLGLNPGNPDERLEIARRTGYLPENGPLYLDMTPYEILKFAANVRDLPRPEAAIDRVVSQVALGSVLHKPALKLSKGYRQRVGMALALLADPEVLILDEPTSGLDPLQIRDVRRLIRELGKEKTILLSTHILQEVEAIADDVIMVSEGRRVFAGTLDELRATSALEDRFYALADGAQEAI